MWNIRSTCVQRRRLLQSKDRTLVLLLLLQIVVYSILRSPAAMNYFYLELTKGQSKNVDQIAFDLLLSTVVLFLTRGFRTEFRKAITKLLRIQAINGNAT